MYLRTCKLSPQITKILDPQIANPQCHICGRSVNFTNYLSPQICCFVQVIFADRPPLSFISTGTNFVVKIHSMTQNFYQNSRNKLREQQAQIQIQ